MCHVLKYLRLGHLVVATDATLILLKVQVHPPCVLPRSEHSEQGRQTGGGGWGVSMQTPLNFGWGVEHLSTPPPQGRQTGGVSTPTEF